MGEDRQVWLVGFEEIENKIHSVLSQMPGISIVSFRDVCDAIEALRNGSQKPGIIIGNYSAADLMLEVAHQKSRYCRVRTAYLSEMDISNLAESHGAKYLKLGSDGKIDGLSCLIQGC
ncbi:MAG: hypothetical protein QXM31_02345 [Candidatus Woesearchaeota archaeon]